jgi:hypothetical protein
MNLLKLCISVFFGLIILSGCKDDDQATDTSTLNNFDSFQEEAFDLMPGGDFSLEDCEFDSQNSILMVGGGGQFLFEPRLIKLNSDFNVEISNDISLDIEPIFRSMDLLKTADQNFVYCSRVFNTTSFDIDIRKFDAEGNLIWESKVGLPSIDEGGVSITEIDDDGLMLIAEDLEFSFTKNSFFLVTLDKNGELVSNLEIADTEIAEMEKILYSPSDNTILILGNYGPGSSGGFSDFIKVSKYSLNGEFISSNILRSQIDFFLNTSDMKMLSDGNILVYMSTNDSSSPNNSTIQLFKIDVDLEIIWSYDYNDINSNLVNDVQESSQGDLLILSKSSSVGAGGLDVILSSLNEDFEINWVKSYGTSSSDQGRRLLIDDNQDIIVVGNSNHATGSEGRFSYFILNTDSNGVPK